MVNHARSRVSIGLLTAALCTSAVLIFWFGQRPVNTSPTSAVLSTHEFPGGLTAPVPLGDVEAVSETDRPLITYVYSESPESRRNLEFFIAQGLHAEADFIFIFNGVTDAVSLVPADTPGVRSIQRDNTCYDLGSHAEVLLKDDLWRRYGRFILMNASVRGPFMPAWADGLCWTDRLLSKITEEVKLVGISLNCWPTPHVQSMVWATDREGLTLLLHPPPTSPRHDVWMEELFTHAEDFPRPAGYQPSGPGWTEKGLAQCFASRQDAVEGEIAATGIILGAGKKVDTLLAVYQTSPGHNATSFCEPLGAWDPQGEGNYGGGSIHPFETIFIKTNRGISPRLIESLTSWADEAGYSSYGQCSKRDRRSLGSA